MFFKLFFLFEYKYPETLKLILAHNNSNLKEYLIKSQFVLMLMNWTKSDVKGFFHTTWYFFKKIYRVSVNKRWISFNSVCIYINGKKCFVSLYASFLFPTVLSKNVRFSSILWKTAQKHSIFLTKNSHFPSRITLDLLK